MSEHTSSAITRNVEVDVLLRAAAKSWLDELPFEQRREVIDWAKRTSHSFEEGSMFMPAAIWADRAHEMLWQVAR